MGGLVVRARLFRVLYGPDFANAHSPTAAICYYVPLNVPQDDVSYRLGLYIMAQVGDCLGSTRVQSLVFTKGPSLFVMKYDGPFRARVLQVCRSFQNPWCFFHTAAPILRNSYSLATMPLRLSWPSG